VDLVAKNVELISASDYLRQSQESIFSNIPKWLQAVLFAAGVAFLGLLATLLDNKAKTKKAASGKGDKSDVEQDIPHY